MKMQSNRQKKKSSQQKKRYHERLKAKEGTTGASTVSSKAEKGESRKEKPSEGRNDQIPAQPTFNKQEDGSKSTKPAKVPHLGNNWDRYEEPPSDPSDSWFSQQESEEQLEQRLIQLLNLPIRHTLPALSADHHSPHLSTKTPAHTDFENEEEIPFLSLDCADLAESLSTLPLHQRLDLDPDYMQLCEAGGNSAESAEMVTSNLENIVDLSVCTKKRTYKFNLQATDSSLSKLLPPGDSLERQEIATPVSTPKQAPLQKTDVGKNAVPSKQNVSSQGDKELDKLLESSLSFQQRKQETQIGVMKGQPEQQFQVSVDQASKPPPSNAELDDMLDELLA